MHPAILYHWKCAQKRRAAHACGGSEVEEETRHFGRHRGGGGPFGVRRPLRYMAHKLDLDDDQVKTLAQILADLKTERAQAAVDDQRTTSAIAEALEGERFDVERAREGLERRVKSAERLRDEVLAALQKTHAMLNEEQRAKLAYMLRSGTLSI